MSARLADSWRNYLINRFPICAPAFDTTIYQVFLQRRREHKLSIRDLLTNPGRGFDGNRFFIPFVLVLVFVASTYFLSCCGIMLSGWLNRKIIARTGTNNLSGNTMPGRVTWVYSEGGCARLAATDLWLTGVRGRDVLLSILLEKLEFNSRFAAIILAAYLVLFCAVLPNGGMTLLLADPILLTSILIAFILYFPACVDWVYVHAVEFQLDWRLNLWSPSYRWPGSGFFKRWNLLLYILFTSIWPLCLFVVGFFMFEFLGDTAIFEELPWLSSIQAGLAAFPAVLVTFPVLRMIGRFARDSTNDKLDLMLIDADLAFEYYMYSVVVGDPDSAARVMDWRNLEPIRRLPAPPPSSFSNPQ